MVLTIDLIVDFKVFIVLAKDFRTNRAGEMVQVVLFAESIDMGTTQGLVALCAEQIQPFKIVCLTEYSNLVCVVL